MASAELMGRHIEQMITWLKELLKGNRKLGQPKPVVKKPTYTPPSPPKRFTMYDTTEPDLIPKSATAVACYLSGALIPTTCPEVHRKFKYAKVLTIAVTAEQDALCLDIENGDARPGQAPGWVRRQQARHIQRPALYANLSTMPAVKAALTKAGISRAAVRLWVADWTYTPHIPKGYDACQWTDRALGRNLDASLCEPSFLA